MTDAEFDRLVEATLAKIPDEFQRHLKDVAFVIQPRPTEAQRIRFGFHPDDADPLGFYDGIPLGERSSFDGPVPHQDTIYIFRAPLLEFCDDDPDILREEIRITVVHEIAHHFGMDEDEVDELGYG